uniref:Uncharacterized protein n=1 Tax=Panagrolaimus davidi TaxID=227884 RepID=A0A914PHK2_9BILA
MHVDNERPLKEYFIPWKMGNFWSSFSGSFLEAGFYSLFLERSLATIKRSTYESITSFWFTAILSGLSLIYSLAISSMWHILPLFLVVIDISVSIPISFGLNLLCAMCVVLLSYYNRKLRKKEIGTMCDLSQRYQIDENIKLLNQWLPVLFIGSITIISNGIFSICGYSFNIGINSYDNTMIYMMGLNVYVFAACLIIIQTDGILIKLFSTWLNFSPSTVIPRNVLGQEIIVSHITVEQHFNELKRYWN